MDLLYRRNLLTNITLFDMCLPGTHDSLSYDLSLTVSAEGTKEYRKIVDLLHTLSAGSLHLLPGEVEEFFRLQAKTQQLTLSQQLDNGIRFVDFRMMREPNTGSWYSTHMMQSKHVVEDYWLELRAWMDAHPHEVVVLWMSQHGNTAATGKDQYPGVPVDSKQHLWKQFVQIFDGLLLDTRESSIWTDTLHKLIGRNHRLVVFVSDYVEMTEQSPLALDARKIQNTWDSDGGVFHEGQTLPKHLNYFHQAPANNERVRAHEGFSLLGMNSQVQKWQLSTAATQRFLPWHSAIVDKLCREKWHLPHAPKHWCPATLLDIVQLSSYYNQRALEFAFLNPRAGFPNALYLDGLDYNGTLRVGTQTLDGADRRGDNEHKDTKYAYVDTILARNFALACDSTPGQREICSGLNKALEDRRKLNPLSRWDEPQLGRHSRWPGDFEDENTRGIDST